MPNEIKIGKKIFLKNAGKNELWLQDQITNNPSILGLGDLIVLSKEKKQPIGGRLDLLLKDPEDNSMYEVEVMLGETDPSHIIRSIEYWDVEKRRYPQRQHFPVLIAESFNRRYFNVVHLLSLNIPFIAIQVDLGELENGQQYLTFTTILDLYAEPEDEDEQMTMVTKSTWEEKAKWSLQTAEEIFAHLGQDDKQLEMRYTSSYISIVKNGKRAYSIGKKADPRSDIWFLERDKSKVEPIKNLLDSNKIDNRYNKYKEFVIIVSKTDKAINNEIFKQIHDIRFPGSE